MRALLILCALMLLSCDRNYEADGSMARAAGKQLGEFGAGVGEAAMEPMKQGLLESQPHWETIEPKTKEACFELTNGVVDEQFLRCRNGWQEYVRTDANGQRKVLQHRPIPR